MENCCRFNPNSSLSVWRKKVTLYWPLLVISGLALGIGFFMSVTGRMPFMDAAMGLFFLLVSVLKLFDINGFSASFSRYDLIVKIFPFYARLYPFIELALAILYLTGVFPVFTNSLTLIVMGMGILGVIGVIRSKQVVDCACIGSGFSLPVGWVTLFEYSVMAIMAAFCLGQV